LARPKRLRFEVFTLPAKLAIHESQLSVQVSIADDRLDEIIAARRQLLQMTESEPA
jgi:phage-related minor tail protein